MNLELIHFDIFFTYTIFQLVVCTVARVDSSNPLFTVNNFKQTFGLKFGFGLSDCCHDNNKKFVKFGSERVRP